MQVVYSMTVNQRRESRGEHDDENRDIGGGSETWVRVPVSIKSGAPLTCPRKG